jgi:hypothetical protein
MLSKYVHPGTPLTGCLHLIRRLKLHWADAVNRTKEASMECPYCGANPQPLHDEVPIPVCCEKAQMEAIYGDPNANPEDFALHCEVKPGVKEAA